MITPTLQQLQEPIHLTAQEILILRFAAGIAVGHAHRRQGWSRLRERGLLDDHFAITLLGKMRLAEILEKKKIK